MTISDIICILGYALFVLALWLNNPLDFSGYGYKDDRDE